MQGQRPEEAGEGAAASAGPDDARGADAVGRAVAAFAHALRLSCSAARRPAARALANEAVAAHVAARAWAERAVAEAGRRPDV